jgi:hypothetical protein
MASAYPTELSTVSVALDLLDVDGDPRIASAVTRTSERLEPLVAPLDYLTIDWDALETIMRSPEDERKLRLAHQLLEAPQDKHGNFDLDDGTYVIVNWIEDGKHRRRLQRIDDPPPL